jgi:cellulose synthase/poly-beta-1,6-N-acetylglucosamine synthase-like glycosyltransferase
VPADPLLFVLGLYVLASFYLLIYGLNAYFMIFVFLRKMKAMRRRNRRVEASFERCFRSAPDSLPIITTQLPIFNEYNVAARVVEAVAAMDYPQDRHEVQILDDSTDETRDLVDATAKRLRQAGHWINVVRRPTREGFKAGALQYGTDRAAGEYIAVFDADFVPPADFLWRCLAHFSSGDPESDNRALVQARWGHLNAQENMLTRAVAIGIDGHFIVEQAARSWNGLMLNFNGTAGLWRKAAIQDAGGWQSVTLTEDMELSYRAQLRGWRIHFLSDLVAPAEIPASFSAFKSQQFRWAKGSIQTALRVAPKVLASKHSWLVKIQSLLHLTHYTIHPCMLAIVLAAGPLLLLMPEPTAQLSWFLSLVLLPLILATLGPTALYCCSQAVAKRSPLTTLKLVPALLMVGFGICLSNTKAVFEALLGRPSEFVRTPKAGIRANKRYRVARNMLPWVEAALGIYALVILILAIAAERPALSPYLLLFAAGFLFIGGGSLRERFQRG